MRLIAILLLCTAASAAAEGQSTQREELVYTGTPTVQVAGEPGAVKETNLNRDEGAKYRLRIVRRGDKYFWASREDRELTMTPGGRYIVFTCQAGMIKVVNPLFDETRARLRATDPDEKYDYIEILHIQLGTVTYWGRGEGIVLPMR